MRPPKEVWLMESSNWVPISGDNGEVLEGKLLGPKF